MPVLWHFRVRSLVKYGSPIILHQPMSIRLFNANNAAFLGVTIAFGTVAFVMVSGHWGEWR